MSDKPKIKFERAVAIEVARELCRELEPVCERLIVAGSLRRRKAMVGDVEILFIPKFITVPKDMFETEERSAADLKIEALVNQGVLARRRNVNGSEMWGDKNKLAVHVASGMPVDLFRATTENWFNYLVCRTGPAESNTRICMAAQDRGWKWNPYGAGFSQGGPLAGPAKEHAVTSEREVFEFLGLPYLEPEARV